MEKRGDKCQKKRIVPLLFTQFLCFLATSGTIGVQVILLHILTHPSVTILLPLPTETARQIGSVIALAVTSLLDLFLLSPFYLGVTAFRYDSAVKTPPVSACFEAYRRRRYALSLRWRLTKWGGLAASALLCFFPALCLFGVSSTSDSTSVPLSLLLLRSAASLLCVAGGIVWSLWMLRYAVAGFFVPETGSVRTALQRSARVTRRHRNTFTRLFARYSGALFLCPLIVPSIVVLPLFYRALATKVVTLERVPRKHPL